MKKQLSLILALFLLLNSISFSAIADTTPSEDAGQFLKGHGIIKGDEKGNLNEEALLTREEAIAILIRMLGKEEDALKAQETSAFSDVNAQHWAAQYIAYANQNGYTNGLGDGTFGLGQTLNAKQFLTFMLRALGHSADWAKEDIMEQAKNMGILKEVDLDDDDDDSNDSIATIKRKEVFKIMKNTLYTNPKEGNQALIQVIGLEKKDNAQPKEDKTQPADTKPFNVKNLNAHNLKDIEILFTEEIDKTSLVDPADMSVKQQINFIGDDLGKLKLTEIDDEEIIVQIEKDFTIAKEYTIVIQGIRSKSNKLLVPVTMKFKISNLEAPEAEELYPIGPDEIMVEFSEPIKVMGKALISTNRNRPVNIEGDQIRQEGRRVILKTPPLKDGETYEVELIGFKDYEGLANKKAKFKFTFDLNSVLIKKSTD